MSGDPQSPLVSRWMLKAEQALAAAAREHGAGDFGLSINRAYYACFYAASAVLLSEGKSFRKHSGVRAAVHKDFVKTGRISVELGEFYDRVFDDRMEVDYELDAIMPDESALGQTAMDQIRQADGFVIAMKRLLPPNRT